MTRVLVTGGAGFIGSHLVRRLLADGAAVRVLDNLSTGKRANLDDVQRDVDWCEADLCDADAVARACTGVETIFHLAARASVPRSVEQPRATHESNITGTLNVLIGARDAGARRVVYSASSSAYGETPILPKVEDMRPQPLSPYAVSKLAAEQYCSVWAHVYGLQTISLRYFNVFGPRQDPHSAYAAVIPAFATRMLKGQKPLIFGDGEQTRDFCFVDNVVNANVLSGKAEALRGEVVNIACGERISLNGVVKRINTLLGTNITPDYQPARAGDVKHSLADISAAARVIGYAPKVMFAEGLSRSIDWYRANAG